MGEFIETIEEKLKFRNKSGFNLGAILSTIGSAGRNPQKLAQILTSFDMCMNILGWKDKPLAKFSSILTQYQASIEGGYHKDLKDVMIAEEQERKIANRKGNSISIMNQ